MHSSIRFVDNLVAMVVIDVTDVVAYIPLMVTVVVDDVIVNFFAVIATVGDISISGRRFGRHFSLRCHIYLHYRHHYRPEMAF